MGNFKGMLAAWLREVRGLTDLYVALASLPALRERFLKAAQETQEASSEIDTLLQAYGGKSPRPGGLPGRLRAACVRRRGEAAALAEVARRERAAAALGMETLARCPNSDPLVTNRLYALARRAQARAAAWNGRP